MSDQQHHNFRHGGARPGHRTLTYRSWEAAKSRCRNQHDPSYPKYGGRGIQFSHEWDEFPSFQRDMGERPATTSLDRIDGSGNYEPGNCRWADDSTQQRNRPLGNRVVRYQGQNILLIELAERTGLRYGLLHDRIVRSGWTAERAVETPIRRWPSQTAAIAAERD